MNPFAGKLTLITGASSGIGRQTALDFAARGAHLILVARREELLNQVAEEIRVSGGQAHVLPCDLADAHARNQLIADISSRRSPPDILINNAGYGNYRPFIKETPSDIARMMEVNYHAPAHLMSAFLPAMIERGSGAVVNVSSGAGKVALPFMAIYCAAKFALCALTEAVSYELAGTGVTIHLINPGPVDTDFFRAGAWEGKPSRKKATPRRVSQAVQDAIRHHRLISYVPPRRGLMVYAFNLLGPIGRLAVRRKYR